MKKFIKDDNFQYCLQQLSEIIDWGLKICKVMDFRNKYNVSGKGIKIAILDTGISNHIDLPIIDKKINCFKDSNFAAHGTFVSGIVGARSNDIGVIGIAPDSELIDIRVLNSGGFTRWAILEEGLRNCLQYNPDIINMSIGCVSQPPKSFTNLINSIIEKGIIVVAAAGNSGENRLDYPAAIPNVIAVGSVNEAQELSNFSNYGQNLVIKAPGENIYSTLPDNQYGSGSGTSYASPFIAGICALILEKEGKMNNIQMINRLKKFKNKEGIVDMMSQGDVEC